jgi:signal transduction histidine kinase/CheY-like chemotaxis protein
VVLAVRERRARLTQRIIMACLIGLVLSQMISWLIVLPWLLAYVPIQYLEALAFAPLISGKAERLPGWRLVLGCATVVMNACCYGALSVALWLVGGLFGGVCAMLLIAAGMINTVAATPGSRLILGCSISTHCLYLLATPFFMGHYGASAAYQSAAGIGCGFFCLFGVALWKAIDDKRAAEAAMRTELERRKAEAEAAAIAKSVYVATIGHELRTPISAMLAGAIELEKAAKGSSLRPHALLIADAGRMMKTLLDDVLDHAKLEAGRMSIEVAPFDLRGLVAQTVRFWQSEARKKGLRLRVEGAAALPAWVEGDPTRIRQILNNLISNAVKFTEKGSVTLRISAWAAEDDGVSVRLQIADTGAGMTREQLGRLFTPFEQADKSTARNYGGTGLGLVISRQLAQLMGGRLTASSREGEGSTFTLAVTFPFAEAPEGAEEIPAEFVAPVADGRPLRVLVADDHEINRRAVQLVLAPLGAEITAVCDGRAAVAAAEAEAFDLIVMDVRMPELDGREATRRIRAGEGPNRDTPVVAVTADTDKVDMEACRAAGMEWFVGKPIDPAALIETVSQALSGPAAAEGDEPAAQTAEPEAADAQEDRPVRVLVVDDHEINRRAVQLVLQPAGCVITTAENGRQAVEVAAREAFDLIVMDIRMPEMNGQDATRAIRSGGGPNSAVQVIALTAEADSSACFEAGMNFFLPKPIDPSKLMATVIQALEAAGGANDAEGDERAVA